MATSKTNSSENILLLQVGGNGTEFIYGTGAVTDKRYQFIQVQEDAVFTTLEDDAGVDLKTDLGIAANTVIAGFIIKAKDGKAIKNITLASGSVVAIL